MSEATQERVETPVVQSPASALVLRADDPSGPTGSIAAFASSANYDAAKRMATALSQSGMVPKEYQGNIANCLVAMELAGRTGASVIAVMQNLHIIQGRPSWSAAFLVGSVNSCGRFSPIRYEMRGQVSQVGWGCRAVARDLASGDILEGVWITWEMAQNEGWVSKPGSKWKTMPEQMIRYRAASFWTRVFAPEISLGMHTSDEVEDFTGPMGPTPGATDLNAALTTAAPAPVTATVAKCPTCLEVLPKHRADCPTQVERSIDDMEEDRELVRRENAKR